MATIILDGTPRQVLLGESTQLAALSANKAKAAQTAAESARDTTLAAMPAINAKIDIFEDYTYGATTIATTGSTVTAGSSVWHSSAIGRTGPLVLLEVACQNAGTGKILLLRPNAGTPANYDCIQSFPLTLAAGVNTFTRTQIETAAGGQVNITSDMRIGFYSASAIFSQGAAGSNVANITGIDMTGRTNVFASATNLFPVLRATVNALTDTPINSRVLTLQGQQASTDTTLSTYRGALTAGYTNLGEIVALSVYGPGAYNRFLWGLDYGTDIIMADGQSNTHDTISLRTFTNATTQVRFTWRLRDLASGALNSSNPQAGDVVYGPYTYNLADLGLTPGTNVTAQCRPQIGTSGIPKSAMIGKRRYCQVEGLDASGARSPIGVGFNNSYSGTVDQGLRGFFGIGTGSDYAGGSLSSPTRLAARAEMSRLFATDELAAAMANTGTAPPARSQCARLRNYRMRRGKRLRPTPEATQNVLSIHGTSWTQLISRWSGNVALQLIAEQGDAGGGWAGFGFATPGTTPYVDGGNQPALINGNVRPTLYPLTYVGTWTSGNGGGTTSLYGQACSVDQCCAQSSTAGNVIKAVAPSSWPTSGRAVDFHWVATADGVMEYSWDGTTWTTINVQGTVGEAYFSALTGVPSSGAVTLQFRVVSGTCQPAGINWKSTGSGLIVHKLAAGGQNLRNLAIMAAKTSWRAAYASLAANTAILFEGTNDQNSVSPTQFGIDVSSWITAVRASDAGKDVLVAVEAENQRTNNPYPMKQFSAVAWAVVKGGEYAWFDTQSVFGSADNPSFYAYGGPAPMMSSDGFHPDPTTGGPALERAWLEVLNNAP